MKPNFFYLACGLQLLAAGCSDVVTIDRTKIPDDMYKIPPQVDSGAGSSDDGGEADGGGGGETATEGDAG
jgi:hypothetical protein